jgi:endonuclease I/chitodextrinase
MKQKLLILALLFSCFSFAQIPAGYYTTATGTGYTLKTQLYNIIKGHTDKGYAGLWTTYATSDRDNQYENDNTIIDMYSENPTGVDPYKYTYITNQCGTYSVEGNCYNREHIIPQSVFNSSAPMVSDAHFITPTDGKVNGQRSNYPHGTVATATWTSLNGSKLGSSSVSGYTGTVFEPINEFKGDIARMYFYFATRYENTVAGYPFAMFNGTSNQVFTTAFLNLLLTWNTQDPVSAREIARNNAIYARQLNRNPYIDHPEYVQLIWNPTADAQAPTAPSSLAVTGTSTSTVSLSWAAATDNIAVTGYNVYMNGALKTTVTGLTTTISGLTASTTYSFYVIAKDAAGNSSVASTTVNATTATPTLDTQAPTAPSNLATTGTTTSTVSLSWLASTDNVGVTGYNVYMNGALKTTLTGLMTTITGLTASTTYSFYVIAKDAAGNLSTASNTINTTTSAAATAAELLFSEYIEGSSNNKALEIANLTGAAINLSIYKIKKQTNGSGAWSTGLSLTGTLNSGSKYVIVNSLIALACYNKATANISTAAGEMTFNGNDAVGLFKNNVLIDIIGTFNGGTANFAADTTLRRKATVTAPSTTFNKTAQWDVLTIDTCNNLGSRMAKPEIKETSSISKDFKIYPNPSNGEFNISFDNPKGDYSIEIYSLIGQKVFEKENTQSTTIVVSNLQKGTYWVRITKDSKSRTEKIIIN